MSEQELLNGSIAMPPKVAAAVAAVMKDVPKLEKGEKNSHGNYQFASIDDFLEAVRPLCAQHGLIIMQDEESFEMKDGWLVMQFSFTLAHSSGETWGHKPRRTIMVSAKMGAQAFGAAQSYALKQFERSLFQIATGEKGNDADEHPPADLPNAKGAPKKAAPKPDAANGKTPINGNGKEPEGKSFEIRPDRGWDHWDEVMHRAIEKSQDVTTLTRLQMDNAKHLQEYGDKFQTAHKAIMDAFTRKASDLAQAPADG